MEIVPRGGVYDYAARYEAGKTTWHAPARLSPELANHVGEVAIAAHSALELRDLSRIDLMLCTDDTLEFLDANVAPGMTETSLLPMAVNAAHLQLGSLLGSLVDRTIERSKQQ